MLQHRPNPYIWATWLPKLIVGESSCWWAAWFRAHHQYTKLPSDFKLAEWQTEHGRLLRDSAADLRAQGYRVSIEDQNAFRVRVGDITVAGKPDIYAAGKGSLLVLDAKTGAPSASHIVQVQLYMAVLPYLRPEYRDFTIEGRVLYPNRATDVPAISIDDAVKGRFREAILRVGGSEPPERVPSIRECKWCDISVGDCEERIDEVSARAIAVDDLFAAAGVGSGHGA